MAELSAAVDAEPATLAAFDVVVDARSPGEFAIDHIPGALNLPVLTDAERAEVGTIYVQESRFKARRIGGSYVARNVARHMETVMADWPASTRPLVYCWRGGMRSNSMGVILANVGWRASVLAGGYRTYRGRVVRRLYEGEPLKKVVLLDGHTGSGKTEVLARLSAQGVQTIDLEGLAAHRGSLFGGLPGQPQPSQKLFESRLLAALQDLDLSRPVVVEAESSKVGQLMVPPVLWSAMNAAPRIVLSARADARARYLAETYSDLGRDPEALIALLARLPDHPGRKRLEAWTALARGGRLAELAAALIEAHYDPAYRRSTRKMAGPAMGKATLDGLDPEAFERAAREVASFVVGG
jgi:tRNA 2-selenouridine synthase